MMSRRGKNQTMFGMTPDKNILVNKLAYKLLNSNQGRYQSFNPQGSELESARGKAPSTRSAFQSQRESVVGAPSSMPKKVWAKDQHSQDVKDILKKCAGA